METVKDSGPNPVDKLYQTNFTDLTPQAIQEAINFLDPSAPDAVEQAEVVVGFAEAGARTYPDSEEWAHILERADKIFRDRVARREELKA